MKPADAKSDPPSTTSPPLSLQLFGPLQVRVDGEVLAPRHSRKEQWLLALLTLRHDRAVEREWLAGTLWPESRVSAAALRETLSDLRHALGPHAAQRLHAPTTQTLRLDLAGAEADVLAFDAALARGDITSLEAAVALYRGPLLEGCAEEWAVPEREAREQAYLEALERLASAAQAQKELEVAVRYLRRVLAVEPLRESAQRALLRALSAGGNFAAALVQYRDLRLLLRRELNAEPDPQTTQLFEELRAQAREKAQAAPSAALAAPLERPSHFLPTPLTELIGRDEEAREVIGHLRSARLVTLVGAGGVGKTRLALRVAQQMADDLPNAVTDGAWFVDLSALSDPRLVPETVAQRLNVGVAGGQSALEALQKHLRSRALLLVLDNCEHLVLACAALAEALLQAAPALRLLATSRERLGLTGETVFRVPSLATPSRDSTTPEAIGAFPAIELFVRRAQAVHPDFALTAQNAPDVARLCARLDGIPLAIELAAARVRSLPPAQLAARLGDRFRLLTGGSRTALPRQQTLRATLEWSWNLLSEEERALLSRLSVFAGGWTLEAAEAVCAGSPIPDGEVFDLLESLADKSMVLAMVLAEEAGSGSVRYRMLETLRQFASERLAESGEAARYRTAHRDYFLALAEEAEPQLRGPEQRVWLERLEREHDNLRVALERRRTEKDTAEARLRLAGALFRFWRVRGYVGEGCAYLVQALAEEGAAGRTPERAKALNGAGWFAWAQGDYRTAKASFEESLAICRELRDQQNIVHSLYGLGDVALSQGDFAVAHSLFEEAYKTVGELGDKGAVAYMLNAQAFQAQVRGDHEAARVLYEQSIAVHRGLGNNVGIALTLMGLGEVAQGQGDYEGAKGFYEESLEIHRELGNKGGEVAYLLSHLGEIASEQSDLEAARVLYEESLSIFREIGERVGIAYSLEAFAGLAGAHGQPERAVRLRGAAESLRREIGAHLPPKEREVQEHNVVVAREALGEEAIQAAWAEGQAMSLEQAIEYALSALDEDLPH